MSDKRTQREFCYDLMRSAPENSDEFWSFHRAAHYYEVAECHKNKDHAAHLARMKAVRAYKKGWKLREKRIPLFRPSIAAATFSEVCHG